jgi:hypothetical protein
MTARGEDIIESFILENRDKFEAQGPPEDHTERFLMKLNRQIRHIISILPYLIRVAVATVLIFTASIIIWNNFIRRDRHEITLRDKISLVVKRVFSR